MIESPFMSPKLRQLYFDLQELFINFNTITFDNKQMIPIYLYPLKKVEEEPLSNIIFHPLIKNENLCSFLVLEDFIHKRLSSLINNIFNIVLSKKNNTNCKDYKQNNFNNKSIERLTNCEDYTNLKWNNLYRILTSTTFARNLISFCLELSNDFKSTKVTFDYPLYQFLINTKSNTIFGIKFSDNEILLFKQIYEFFIIKFFTKSFESTINIPLNSDEFPKFYSLLKLYLEIKKLIKEEYNINLGVVKNIDFDTRINNLNDYLYRNTDLLNLKALSQIQKLDKEAYENELKIREETSPNWLLLKDNIMKKKKDEITQEELNKKFNNEYLNTYYQKIALYFARKDAEIEIFNREYMKNSQDFHIILYMQRLALQIIESDGGLLFFDTRNKKYYFRSDSENNIIPYDKKDILVILNRAMQKNLPKYHIYNQDSSFHSIELALIENLNDVSKEKPKNEINTSYVTKILIFTNQIPSIDGEVFDLSRNEEIFQSKTDLLFKRNIFVATEFLAKRKEYNYVNILEINEQTTNSFIKKFIYQMVNEDVEKSEYIINWLAYYFQNLKKTGTALVLLGESDVTEKIFWNLIIKKIFGRKYCSTINDTEYETPFLEDIIRHKLFFNIADIKNAGTIFDDDTLALIVKELLIQQSVEFTNETGNEEKLEIHGQLLITATNPAPYLKKSLSKCTVIDTVNIDKIMDIFGLEDETELEDKILKDLEQFSNLLNNYNVKEEIVKEKFITKEREKLKGITTSNVNKDDIENSLDKFIEAIKNKDIEYFEKVKNIENGTIYEHLKNSFEKEDGYFIGQDLLLYYNALNEQKFDKKKDLMDRLKAKDKMFLQEVKTLKILTSDGKEEVLLQGYKTSKETGNKELYKISNYTLAESITIPYGAVITTSQDNIKKYHHDDLEYAIKINKEYKDKKTQEETKK